MTESASAAVLLVVAIMAATVPVPAAAQRGQVACRPFGFGASG